MLSSVWSLVVSAFYILIAIIFQAFTELIVKLYDLIIMLSDVNFFNSPVFQNVRNNIFGLIGLFMVFKLAFSVIQYITDPEKLSDSKMGASKILTRLVIVLILLGTVNTIFEKAIEFQGLVLKGAVIEKIVFGTDDVSNRTSVENSMNPSKTSFSTARYLSYAIMSPFLRFNVDDDIWGDTGLSSDELNEVCNEFLRPTDYDLEDVCENPSPCMQVIENENEDIKEEMCTGLNERNVYKSVRGVLGLKIDKKNLISLDLLGIVFGGICAVVLLIICVGVSIRTIKLSFLQLISPLPIISYIDPKSGDNGMFNKWVKETIKTYIDLFVRLVAFYFAVLVIVKVLLTFGNGNGIQSVTGDFAYSFSSTPMVYIFLIIGCFLFALQLPKLIENLFGSMGGFKRDAKSTAAIAGGIAGITGGIIGGGISNAIGTAKNISKANDGKLGFRGALRAGAAGITGAVGTGGRAIQGTINNTKVSGDGLSGKSWNPFVSGRAISDSAITRTGNIRNANNVVYTDSNGRVRSNGSVSSSFNRAYGRFASMAGIKETVSPTSRINSDIKEMEKQVRKFEEQRTILDGQMNSVYSQLNDLRSQRAALKNSIDSSKYEAMGGKFDESINDYVFDFNGTEIRLNDMSYAQYESIYAKNMANLSGSDLANYESKYSINNENDFNTTKTQIETNFEKISTLRNQEIVTQREYNRISDEHKKYTDAINTRNDAISRRRKDVETIKNAEKKN